MGDETPQNLMNLDLNLGPVVHPSEDDEPETMNLEDWLEEPIREAVGNRTRARRRWRSLWRPVPIPMESRNMAMELIGGGGLETGEGSIAAAERPPEVTKTCDNGNGCLENEVVVEKEEFEKSNVDEGSFFDCNICLDLASEPVVTSCGHLYCWSCLYQWLHIHSDAQECPICKGEVTFKTITPIYGRGNPKRVPEEDSSLKIPQRPQAKRTEGWRQTVQRNSFAVPVEEMIRSLGGRFDLAEDFLNAHTLLPENSRINPERTNSLVNRILASRALRRQQNTASASASSDVEGESHRLSPLLSRRSNRAATISNLTSALSSAERLVESYFRNHHVDRNQEGPPSMDDRDSVSSIAAIIQSESQTVDNAAEIDSRVSLSTSSFRRRSDPPGVSDVDSGDSRALRRRRLQ